LGTFTEQSLLRLAATVPDMKRRDAEWCLWMVESYPKTLIALAMLPDFAAGNKEVPEKMADATSAAIFVDYRWLRSNSKQHHQH
jgi:hypothetical protein